jgi:hypothetical protein
LLFLREKCVTLLKQGKIWSGHSLRAFWAIFGYLWACISVTDHNIDHWTLSIVWWYVIVFNKIVIHKINKEFYGIIFIFIYIIYSYCFVESVRENCENRNDPDLVEAFLKKWWVESDFKAPKLPLSLRFKGSGFFLSMCDVKIFLTFTSPNMVLLWQLFCLFCSCI